MLAVRRTAIAAIAMRRRHYWSPAAGGSDAVRDMAAELGYLRASPLQQRREAGNVMNHALFPVERRRVLRHLRRGLLRAESGLSLQGPLRATADPATSFVHRTPQTYGNIKNLVSSGAGFSAIGVCWHSTVPSVQRRLYRREA
jgi:hypothetical protein